MSLSQSRQQNPPPTVQQTGSQADDDVKQPFSIRQYVLASRHRSIFHSWPFPEKYLQMCLNRGLRDVLPPFGFQTSSLAESSSLKGGSNLNMHSTNYDSKEEAEFCKTEVQQHVIEHPQNTIKNECALLMSHEERYIVTSNHSEEGNQHNCNASVNLSESAADTFTVLPNSVQVVHNKSCPSLVTKAMKDKRGRRKGRCKKRSMVDILAVARHCTLEEIHKMNKFFYAEAVTEETEACQQMVPPFENISKSENSFRKGASEEDHEAANNIDMTGKGTLLLKFKLNGCNVNWNI